MELEIEMEYGNAPGTVTVYTYMYASGINIAS